MIDPELLDEYLTLSGERARAGILDCWTDALDGKTVEEHMREVVEQHRAQEEA